MQGIVNLARRFKACHIEEASIKAVNAGLRGCKAVRRLVENIAKKGQAIKKDKNNLTQDQALIRTPEDYGAFWNQNAASGGSGLKQSTRETTGQQKGEKRYVMSREQLRQGLAQRKLAQGNRNFWFGMRRTGFEKSGRVSKAVSQSQINHIIILKLAQAGIFGAVEKHISGGDLPVVADLVFCEDL